MHSRYPSSGQWSTGGAPTGGIRRRACCCCAGLGFGASLLFFGGALALALSTPRATPEVRQRQSEVRDRWAATDSATAKRTADRAVERAQTMRKQVTEQARAGGAVPFEASVSEDEVNALLAADAGAREALRASGVSGVVVLFEEGRAVLSGRVQRSGLDLEVTADLVPTVGADGRVAVAVENARAGRFPLPASLVSQARDALAKAIENQDPERGRIESVAIERGKLTIRGRVEPVGTAGEERMSPAG